MSRILDITQEVGLAVNWEKLAKDLIREFNISATEEDIISFCTENEAKYLIVEDYGKEIKEIQTNDLTGDEEIYRVHEETD